MKYTITIVICAILLIDNIVCVPVPVPAPAPSPIGPQDAQILRFDSDVHPEGYKFFVETSDGKIHQEEGQLKDVGTDHEAIVVRGSFSYVGDDGQTYQVNYLADENGFQPEGAHLPHN